MNEPSDPGRAPTSPSGADRRAIQRALTRERGGATFLHGKYARFVRAVIRRFVKDESTVDDVSQEAFARAFQNLVNLKDVGKLKSWLAMIAARAFLKYRRDAAPRAPEVPLPPDGSGEVFVDPTSDVEELIRVHDMRAQVAGLPEPYRTTLVQRYWEDLPLAEIARRQEIQLSLAKYRVQQGLRLLRARLSLEGADTD